MKAIVVHETGGADVMRLEQLPEPVPGEGEVLVRVAAAGVNPVDTYLRAGEQGYAPPRLPWTPGIDAGGEVVRVGAGVRGFAPGDRVYTSGSLTGTYAELALCRVDQLHPLPPGLEPELGGAINIPYATALTALTLRGSAQEGETLLVHGATGGVGLAALQLGRVLGLQCYGTGGSEAGLALIEAQGAVALDHRDPAHLQDFLERTGDRGADLVLEMAAQANLGQDLTVLARGGRVVVIGCRGTVEIPPRELMRREADIRGMSLFNLQRESKKRIHEALAQWFEKGLLSPVIRERLPLEEAPRAHEQVRQPGALGKILLVP